AARAAETLRSAPPDEVVALLRERLKAVKADEARVQALLEEIDSPQFVKRQRAMEELEYLGKTIQPQLEKALASHPPLEVRRRVELLLSRFQPVAVHVSQEALMLQIIEAKQARINLNPNVKRPNGDLVFRTDSSVTLRDSPNNPQTL